MERGDLHAGQQVRVAASRVSADGVVLDPRPVFPVDGGRSQFATSIAKNGGFVTIAWEEADVRIIRGQRSFQNREVKVGKLAPHAGMVSYPPITVASYDGQSHDSDPTSPSIACNERDCLAFYMEGAGSYGSVRTAFMDAPLLDTGGRIGTTARLGDVHEPTTGIWDESPSVVWDGHAFAASWNRHMPDDYDIVMQRFQPDGRPADSGEVLVAHSPQVEMNPSLSTRGDGLVTVLYQRTTVEPEYGLVAIFLRQELLRRRLSTR